jgi:hypothetical protein
MHCSAWSAGGSAGSERLSEQVRKGQSRKMYEKYSCKMEKSTEIQICGSTESLSGLAVHEPLASRLVCTGP